MKWLECGAHDFFVGPVATEEVQKELPPGFVATGPLGAVGGPGAGAGQSLLLFTARRCGGGTIGEESIGPFSFFAWAFAVEPPPEYANASVSSNATLFHVVDDPHVGAVLRGWGMGDAGTVSLTSSAVGPSSEQMHAVASYENVTYDFTSTCPTVGAHAPGTDNKGTVSRGFGLLHHELGGVAHFVALNDQPGAAGTGAYRIEGATGVIGNHPSGQAAVSCGTEPFTSQEIILKQAKPAQALS